MGQHSGNGVLGLEGTKTAGCTDRASPGSRKPGSTQYGNKRMFLSSGVPLSSWVSLTSS